VSRGYETLHTARKAGKCANAHAASVGNAPGCLLAINPGDRYMEGDFDPASAGGFGKERVCYACFERDHARAEGGSAGISEYERRVRDLEAEGLTRSDAQAVADVEGLDETENRACTGGAE
jgi:hypothetical protein